MGPKHTPKEGRTPRRRPPEERREQILAAAVKLFARQGYARTTTKEIAREAGLSEGTIYKYFASKQDLLFSFIARAGVQTLEAVFAGSEGASDAEVIRGFFLDRLTLAERNLPLIKVVLGEALFDAELARAFARHVAQPITAMIEQYLTAGMRAGRFRKLDPKLAARALAGLFLTCGVLWPALLPGERHAPKPQELADTLTTLYLDGLAARHRPQARRSA